MNLPSEIDVLKIVCSKLEKAKIRYMLTGSLASNFYSTPRMTRDIDIVIELAKPAIDQLFQLFSIDFYRLDNEYLHTWIQKLDLRAIYDKVPIDE